MGRAVLGLAMMLVTAPLLVHGVEEGPCVPGQMSQNRPFLPQVAPAPCTTTLQVGKRDSHQMAQLSPCQALPVANNIFAKEEKGPGGNGKPRVPASHGNPRRYQL